MAEHPLDGLDVGSDADGQAGCGVPQVVRGERTDAHRPHGRVEDVAPEVAVVEEPTGSVGTDKLVRAPTRHLLGQGVDQESRKRHDPALMGLGRNGL